ncbi:MAG: preprotein translocase subunit SecE [Holophagaceae bacterium]
MIATIKQQTKDLFAELQRVDWPNREKVVSSTVTVVAISIFIGLFLWLADLGLTWVMQRVLPHS